MGSKANPSTPFIVTGRRRNGTITYLCPDAEWALRKRGHFERMGYEGIAVTGPDGADVAMNELVQLARVSGRRALVAT